MPALRRTRARIHWLIASAIAVLVFTVPASAMLQDVEVFATDESKAKTAEIRLTHPLSVVRALPVTSDREVVLVLEATDTNHYRDWSYSKLDIDETDHLLTSVELEGNSAVGLKLTIRFRNSVFTEVLPQYTKNHILLTFDKLNKAQRLLDNKPAKDGVFALTLESRQQALPELKDIPKSVADEYDIYIVPFEKAGETWQRLRIASFTTESKANQVKALLSGLYPDAYVAEISDEEATFAQTFKLNPDLGLARVEQSSDTIDSKNVRMDVRAVTPSTIDETPDTAVAAGDWEERPALPKSQWQQLLEEADRAFELKNYAKAIPLYTKLSERADGEIQQHSLEMLGVARELQRQIAHAKAVYERYLALYPGTDGAARVSQRLSALLALTEPPKAGLRAVKRRRADPQWRVASYLSQYYRRHELEIDGDKTVALDGIFTNGNVSARRMGGVIDHELRLSVAYLHDFTDRLGNKDLQFSTAFWDAYSNEYRTGFRIGRQSKYDAGIIGRFDGATLRHQLNERIEIGAVGGYLLDSSFDSPSTDRPVYGVYGKIESASGALSVSPYAVQQKINGIIDRRAVGVQGQWVNDTTMIWSNVDYDVYHKVLNNVMAMANFGIGKQSSYSVSFDQRRSPYLTTRNALIGQPFEELTELEQALLDIELKELASDRTSTTQSVRASWNRALNDRWQFTTDIILTDTSSTDTSGNVTALDGHQDIYYSMQLRAQDVFGEGTYSGMLARFSDSDSASTTSLYWNSRLQLSEKFWWYPRLRVDYRDFKSTDDTQQRYVPSLRIDYRHGKRVRFEFEIGYDYTTRETVRNDIDISGLFISAGYRATF